MDPTTALLAGAVAGAAIAVQVGAVTLLLVEASIVAGPRAGAAAGLGVATVDLAFAAVAVAVGGGAGALLSSHEAEIRIVAAAALAAIAVHGLVEITREGREAPAPGAATPRGSTATAHYARFVAITAANPLTIASFAALAASLSLGGLAAAAAFALGVGIASGAWQLVLALAAGHAGRRLTDGMRRGLAIGGRVAVLAIAVHLALAV